MIDQRSSDADLPEFREIVVYKGREVLRPKKRAWKTPDEEEDGRRPMPTSSTQEGSRTRHGTTRESAIERIDESFGPEQSSKCVLSYGSHDAVTQWRDSFVERLKEQKGMLNRFDEFGTTGFGESMSDILMSTGLKNELNRVKEVTKKLKGKMLYRKNIMTRFVQEVSKLNEGNICVDGDPVYKLYIEGDMRLRNAG